MSNRGFVTLDRDLLDSAIWNINKAFDDRSAWIDLILLVNHEDREIFINGKPMIIHAGQRWTSMTKLASRWGWNRARVKRYFRMLEMSQMITTNVTTHGILITLTNWALRQGEHKKKWKNRTTDDTADGTADGTAHGTTDGTQTKNEERTIKNEKEINRPQGGPKVGDVVGGRVME